MIRIKNIGLSWITVADFKKSHEFFTKTLGLTTDSYNPEMGWMELKGQSGECSLGVGAYTPEHGETDKPGQNAVVTFTVDDLLASKKTLESNGVKFVGEILEIPGHVKMVTFLDPDGNKFQLVQMLS